MTKEFIYPVVTNGLFNGHTVIPESFYSRIHIIIPVFNESYSIIQLIEKIYECFVNLPKPIITIIDDGSTDDTLYELEQSSYNINIISNKKNSGKGVSLINGFKICSEDDIVITMDGDGEHIPEDIFALVQPIIEGKVKSVIGTRFLDNKFLKIFYRKYFGSYSNNGKRLNYIRRFGNWLFSLFIWFATRNWIIDSQSGFRAFAPGVVKEFDLSSKGFQIETEITMQLIKNGIQIDEIPIKTGTVNRDSYMGIFRDSIKNIITIIRIVLPKSISNWLIRNFEFISQKLNLLNKYEEIDSILLRNFIKSTNIPPQKASQDVYF